MLNTPRARNGMVTSPHHLASQAGLQILRDGGTAIEAAVACIACLSVLYPHMTGIGGDSFWLISQDEADPIAIDACGVTGAHVDANLYRRNALAAIPQRGPLAVNTVAGTIAGWEAALKLSNDWQPGLSLSRILRDAIDYADGGFPVTRSQAELTAEKLPGLRSIAGFADTFAAAGKAHPEGAIMRLGPLARTLRQLAGEGLDSFYRGPLSRLIAADLEEVGAPLILDDLNTYRPLQRTPLTVRVTGAELFNMPPPTQGLSSLMILALFDRLGVTAPEGFDHIHGLVEATKQAFLVRDREICDPQFMATPASEFLRAEFLDGLAGRIDRDAALPWPAAPSAGDTVWIGAVDRQGRSVSLIQSIFFEFGSGVVLPSTGITWQNRGCSFSLDSSARNTV
ncbi:MAG: gamma-glutamyltransferase family protein, partial [Rhizomicrobium sp.]